MKNSNTLVEVTPPVTAFSDLKTYNLLLVLTTVHEVVPFPFSITVTNSAPVFAITPLTSTNVYIGETKSYKLPTI